VSYDRCDEGPCGNVPAYGLLRNHLRNLPEHIRVCFAASGDIQNTIEIVCQLPEHFQGSLIVYLNDYNHKIAVRNLLMLELLRFYGFEAIDTVIALWCSVLLTANQLLVCDDAARALLDRTLTETKFHEMHFPGSRGSTLITQFDKSTVESHTKGGCTRFSSGYYYLEILYTATKLCSELQAGMFTTCPQSCLEGVFRAWPSASIRSR
jgi:hypothetical protein